MKRILVAGLISLCAGFATARTWTDDTGSYTIEAELVAFDDDRVILKRDADGALGSVDRARLSDADQQHLGTGEAAASAGKWRDASQTWTMASGLKVPGRVVDFVRRDVTVQRRRGHVYVNNRRFSNLPEIYQRIAPLVVGYHEDNKVSDEKSLESWLVHKKGEPQSYSVDGVMLELESGDEYAVPFFLFSDDDLAILQPGWDRWLASQDDYEAQEDYTLELQSKAAAYQRDEDSQRQVARLQLGMQAVEIGLTSLWEVTLYPQNGGQPVWAVVPGRDSRTAQSNALAQNPGCTLGPVRRVSR